MSGPVGGLQGDLEYVTAVLQERLDLEDLRRGVDVDAPENELWIGERLSHRLVEVALIQAKLPHRSTHAHPRSHELRGGVDPQAHAYISALFLRDRRQALDLAQRLD